MCFPLTPWTVPPRSLNAGNDWRFSCFWLLWLYFGSEREGYQSLSPDVFRFSAGGWRFREELQCTEGSRARSVAGRKERPSFRHAGPAEDRIAMAVQSDSVR